MRIPETIIEDIMRRADLVEVAQAFMDLKKAGENDFKACCPFHHEKTPSFHLNSAKQVYHCFGCGVGGNVITLVKALVNTDYVGAIRWLADRYNVVIPEGYDDGVDAAEAKRRRRLHEDGLRLLDAAATWFRQQLDTPEGAAARDYLDSRGLDAPTVERYRIGYAPEGRDTLVQWALANGFTREALTGTGLAIARDDGRLMDRFHQRLMFSICDELSRVVAFSGRVLGPTPPNTGKYVNSPESDYFHKGGILYGLNIARQAFRRAGWALICEGQLDVIACHRAGLEQAVASQGTAFTEEHVRLLSRANVKCAHLAFDGDAAGHKATLRTVKLLYAGGIQPLITTLPEGEDPDGLFRHGGAEAVQQVMAAAEPAVQFAFRVFHAQYPGGTPEENSRIADEMLAVIACIQDDVAREGHCQWLARQLSLRPELLLNLLAGQRQAAQEAAQLEARRAAGAAPANAYPRQEPAAPVVVPMLAWEGNANLARKGLVTAVLDLALHYSEAARRFAAADAMAALAGDTPALQALNYILANTSEGDWREGVDYVARSEWVTDPIVSSVLTSSDFAGDAAADGTLPEMPARAVEDCLRRLEEMAINAEQARLQAQDSSATAADADDEKAAGEKLKAALELARRKKSLRRW